MAPGRPMVGANEGAGRVVVEARVTGTPMEKAAEPVLGTELIPKERYTSEEFMKLEWERMWTKVWNIAGREQDIPNVGDYFTTELGPESFLIVREAEDKVRAFYNVCPHRGNQIRNPYHYHIFPNITLNTHATRVMFFRQRPHPTDPNKMYYDLQNYVRIPEGAEPPPRPPHTQHTHGDISLGLVLDQDSYNLPRVQKGMNSRAFKGLLINYRERRIRHMHKTLDDYIYGPDR